MDKTVPVWVSQWGDCAHTLLVDVLDKNGLIMLITMYGEY